MQGFPGKMRKKNHEVAIPLNFIAIAAGLKVEEASVTFAFMLVLGCHCLWGHCNLNK